MVHFVGAGSGAADLITLRGKKFLEEADVIIYAGSLVNPQLLEYAREDCTIFNSAKNDSGGSSGGDLPGRRRRKDYRPSSYRGSLSLRSHPGNRWTCWMRKGYPMITVRV